MRLLSRVVWKEGRKGWRDEKKEEIIWRSVRYFGERMKGGGRKGVGEFIFTQIACPFETGGSSYDCVAL